MEKIIGALMILLLSVLVPSKVQDANDAAASTNAGNGTGGAGVATAVTVPTFDIGNIVLFPNRDFITVEGYQQYLGQTATKTAEVVVTIADAARQETLHAFTIEVLE